MAGGSIIIDESAKDLEAFGIAPDVIPEDSSTKPFEVWEENEEAVRMFLRLTSQWRVNMDRIIGLDYAVLFELMNLYAIVDRKDLFESIQIMEGAAIPIMNKRA